MSRKGKAGPLEAGRGKYSPPVNPERVTSEALKRRDNGVLQKLRKLQRTGSREVSDFLGPKEAFSEYFRRILEV